MDALGRSMSFETPLQAGQRLKAAVPAVVREGPEKSSAKQPKGLAKGEELTISAVDRTASGSVRVQLESGGWATAVTSDGRELLAAPAAATSTTAGARRKVEALRARRAAGGGARHQPREKNVGASPAAAASADACAGDESIKVAYFPDPKKVKAKPGYPSADVRERLQREGRFEFVQISAKQLLRGCLEDEGFTVLCVPGGFANNTDSALGDKGYAIIQQFVCGGGGYVGICAGAYLGCWLGLLPVEIEDGDWRRGKGQCDVLFSESARDIDAKDLRARIRYNNGPLFDIDRGSAEGPVDVLATFQTAFNGRRDQCEDRMLGDAAAVTGLFGEGRVVLISPHMEGFAEHGATFRNIFRLCSNGSSYAMEKEQQAEERRAEARLKQVLAAAADGREPPAEPAPPLQRTTSEGLRFTAAAALARSSSCSCDHDEAEEEAPKKKPAASASAGAAAINKASAPPAAAVVVDPSQLTGLAKQKYLKQQKALQQARDEQRLQDKLAAAKAGLSLDEYLVMKSGGMDLPTAGASPPDSDEEGEGGEGGENASRTASTRLSELPGLAVSSPKKLEADGFSTNRVPYICAVSASPLHFTAPHGLMLAKGTASGTRNHKREQYSTEIALKLALAWQLWDGEGLKAWQQAQANRIGRAEQDVEAEQVDETEEEEEDDDRDESAARTAADVARLGCWRDSDAAPLRPPASFMIWNAKTARPRDSNNLDPNYCDELACRSGPWHSALHCWRALQPPSSGTDAAVRAAAAAAHAVASAAAASAGCAPPPARDDRIRMLHVDVHGKMDRKNNLDLDVGLGPMEQVWDEEYDTGSTERFAGPIKAVLADAFERCFDGAPRIFNAKARAKMAPSVELDPRLHGYWGDDCEKTISHQSVEMLGVPALQLEIPFCMRKELVENDVFFKCFAQAIFEAADHVLEVGCSVADEKLLEPSVKKLAPLTLTQLEPPLIAQMLKDLEGTDNERTHGKQI